MMMRFQKEEVPGAAQGYEPLRFIFDEDSQAAADVTQSMHLTSKMRGIGQRRLLGQGFKPI